PRARRLSRVGSACILDAEHHSTQPRRPPIGGRGVRRTAPRGGRPGDGVELITELRRRRPGLPVLVLTTYGTGEDLRLANREIGRALHVSEATVKTHLVR